MVTIILSCILVTSSAEVISQLLTNLFVKFYGKPPIKPFSCGYCLSFWFGLIVFGFSFAGFGIACFCAILHTIYKTWI
jgi:hypothetical protein